MNTVFAFALGLEVALMETGEIGVVVARTEYFEPREGPRYLVRHGPARPFAPRNPPERWYPESRLIPAAGNEGRAQR